MIGMLLRLPTTAKSSVRVREDTLNRLTAERVDEIKQWIREAAANPSLVLGTSPSPWNNASITDGHRAQELIDLAQRAAYQLWPKFESLLGELVQCVGLRPPGTLDQTAKLLDVLDGVRAIREKYAADIFSARPAELAQALKPATGSIIGKAWAFVTNKAYRCSRRTLLALRTVAASTAILQTEALQAADVLRRWQALGPSSDVPIAADGHTELANVFTTLRDATETLGAITERAHSATCHLWR